MFTVELYGGPLHGHVEARPDLPPVLQAPYYPEPPVIGPLPEAPDPLPDARAYDVALYVRWWQDGDVVYYRFMAKPAPPEPVLHDEGAGL